MEELYFLGAGFSKEIYSSMPLLGDLSITVKNELRSEIIRKVPKLENYDFETLISYVYNNHPWKQIHEKFDELGLYHKIIEIVRKELNEKENDFFSKLSIESLDPKMRKFFQHLADERSTLITLNYDTLVENILLNYSENIGGGILKPFANATGICTDLYRLPFLDLGYRWGGAMLRGDFLKKDGIHLIKLHGSTSWFGTADLADSNLSIYYANDHYKTDFDNLRIQGLLPVIIPPTFDKGQFYSANNILRSLWLQARNALENANSITIIGYSLPISDSYIRLLFQVATANSLTVKIVNPSSNEIKFTDSVKSYFSWIEPNKLYFFNTFKDYIDSL
jgi:hypothetical protein